MLFLQIMGGLFVFLILFILLGIPLGYTKIEKTIKEENTTYDVIVGKNSGE